MKHPAKYSDAILRAIRPLLPQSGIILDPFAGTGRVHELGTEDRDTVGVEIEPEWAAMHPGTYEGNALDMPWYDDVFAAIVTSPTYGNRMADHHEAKDASKRMTYRHTLGRPLHKDNSGQLQWGPLYWDFHVHAWCEAIRVLVPGGRFILNVKDHVRKGKRVPVSAWHFKTLRALGLTTVAVRRVPVPGMGFGANGKLRVNHEWVLAFDKPAA